MVWGEVIYCEQDCVVCIWAAPRIVIVEDPSQWLSIRNPTLRGLFY